MLLPCHPEFTSSAGRPASGPLAELENAFGFKIFSWYTKEALDRAMEIWTRNIVKLAGGSGKIWRD